MKKLILIIIISFLYFSGFSQKYDLIVTKKGDSIACHIEKVTPTVIYYEMKSYNKWIYTMINPDDVLEFKYDCIDKNDFKFKGRTSYIKCKKK